MIARAALPLTAADLQTQPNRTGQQHQRAPVLVAQPHMPPTARAELPRRPQPMFPIRSGPRRQPSHLVPPKAVKPLLPQRTTPASFADLVKKSEPLWVWKAWDRASGQLVDWECGGRDKVTCERLIERLKRWRTRLYGADDYAVYGVLLPVGQLYTGKDETHGVERDTARQRHWLARFRRRSIVVSKTKRMVDVSIALFARFAGNDRIADLISMLA